MCNDASAIRSSSVAFIGCNCSKFPAATTGFMQVHFISCYSDNRRGHSAQVFPTENNPTEYTSSLIS